MVEDSGFYECQATIHPPQSIIVKLVVLGKNFRVPALETYPELVRPQVLIQSYSVDLARPSLGLAKLSGGPRGFQNSKKKITKSENY